MLTNLKEIKYLISPILFAIENSDRRDNVEISLYGSTRWMKELTVGGSKSPIYRITIDYMSSDIEIISI